MSETFAFVVGIDRYDQRDWTLSTGGPSLNALAMVEWLLDATVPPKNIFLFLDTAIEKESARQELEKQIGQLEARKVVVTRSADWKTIDDFWRDALAGAHPVDSRLFMYWCGHGVVDGDCNRILICRDFNVEKQLTNRVFHCTHVLRRLLGPPYQSFSQQIILADVCALKAGFDIEAGKGAANVGNATDQALFYATPELEYATETNGRGVFTEVALQVLRGFKTWPPVQAFEEAMERAFAKVQHRTFRVVHYNREQQRSERIIGRTAGGAADTLQDQLLTVLKDLQVSDDVYRPHFLRTASAVGMPELYQAQGLSGMLRELARLRDRSSSSGLSSALIQFLVRLAQEKALAAPLEDWLAQHARGEGNAIANARARLAKEKAVKILLCEVEHDSQEEPRKYQLYVRTHELTPMRIRYPARAVKGWKEFCHALQADLADVVEHHGITDFQIHFIVDYGLFDERFHALPLPGGGTLGERHVVVLRYRKRVRYATDVTRGPWCSYAEALRSRKPEEVKLLPVADAQLPAERGLCYTSFVVPSRSDAAPAGSTEKKILRQLLDKGVPYICWLHDLHAPDALGKLEPEFRSWLKQTATLDRFPVVLAEKRNSGNRYASDATLLWDDPEFEPFRKTSGVRSQ